MKKGYSFLPGWLAGASLLQAAPGDIDPALNLALGGNPATVISLATLPDGKLLFGGYFTSSGGLTRNHLARMNLNATLDSPFNPNVENTPMTVLVLPDERVFFAGYFLSVGSVSRGRVARLNANGLLDSGYNPGANDIVYSASLLPEDKILIGGVFTTVGGNTRSYLARLNANGTFDSTFNTNVNERVRRSLVLPDGKIVLAGNFTTAGGQPRTGMARLHADGSLDASFNANLNGPVYCAVLLPDGKILAGGTFTSAGDIEHRNLVRLHPGGTVDHAYNPVANGLVRSIAVQTDGKTVIGGEFTQINGAARSRLARLDANGSLDSAFTTGANTVVSGLLLQADGKLLVGGEYTTFGSQSRAALVRLENEPAAQSLSVPEPDRIRWMRGGTSPEAEGVTFDLSTDGGGSWLPLGSAVRITGGWEAAQVDLSPSGRIRARARIAGGMGNTSSSLIETTASYSFTAAEIWRFANFGSITSDGDAADNADPDHDGVENLIEYAFALNPLIPDAASLPQWQSVNGEYALTFTLPPGVSCVAESSTTLEAAAWEPLSNLSVPPQYSFQLSPSAESRLYLRLRVSAP